MSWTGYMRLSRTSGSGQGFIDVPVLQWNEMERSLQMALQDFYDTRAVRYETVPLPLPPAGLIAGKEVVAK